MTVAWPLSSKHTKIFSKVEFTKSIATLKGLNVLPNTYNLKWGILVRDKCDEYVGNEEISIGENKKTGPALSEVNLRLYYQHDSQYIS